MRIPAFLLLALLPLAPVRAQRKPPARAPAQAPVPVKPPAVCNGSIVSKIEIHSYLAGSSFAADAWKAATGFLGMHSTPTRPEVIRAYLRLTEGSECTELDRSESERLLRAQRFISYATVTALPDGPLKVRIVVETVDELPVLVGGGFQGTAFQSILLGNQNLNGRGITLELSEQQGFGYRTGFGGDFIQYGAFGHPLTLAIGGEVDPQGDAVRFAFSKPFFTEQQSNGFHIGADELNNYYDLKRPVGDDVFLNVRRSNWDFAIGSRAGQVGNTGAVGVLGGTLFGESLNTASHAVFITSDSGLVLVPNLPEVDNRYHQLSVVRVGVYGGLRSLRFTKIRGFDALTAEQDVGSGMEVGLLVGPSIWESNHIGDFFLSSEFYSGIGSPTSFLEMRITSEGRADRENQRWDGVVSDGKFVWHLKPTETETAIATLEVSGIQHLELPVQLSFADHQGGLPGFSSSQVVGGQRAVLRVEERHLMPLFTKKADWAVAVFADAGKIWSGDVPFGQTSPVRGALGVSLLGAFPAGSKQTYRVDFAVPVNPDGSKFEFRFTLSNETLSIWRQPNDVAVARSPAVLQNLGSWTPR